MTSMLNRVEIFYPNEGQKLVFLAELLIILSLVVVSHSYPVILTSSCKPQLYNVSSISLISLFKFLPQNNVILFYLFKFF